MLQQEKEKSSVLSKTLKNVLIRVESTLDNVNIRDSTLKIIHDQSIKPDLSSSSAVKSYHKNIIRGVSVRNDNHNELLASFKRIQLDCESTFTEIENRVLFEDSCQPISQTKYENSTSVNKNGILSRNIHSSRVPFYEDVKYLKAPKSVKFSIPLNDYLSHESLSPINAPINTSDDKIEIDIPGPSRIENSFPKTKEPESFEQIQRNIEKFRNTPVDKLDWSLLDVSSNSTIIENNKATAKLEANSKGLVSEIDQLTREWEEFASSNDINRNNDDLFAYECHGVSQGLKSSASQAEKIVNSFLAESVNKSKSSEMTDSESEN